MVMFEPNWTDAGEPGGVNWTTRKPLSNAKSASSRHSELLVERLRLVDVGDGDDDGLELEIGAHYVLLVCVGFP